MEYIALKHFHMTCAAASGFLFLLRGRWMMRSSPLLQQRWVRIAPHVIDTLLLLSAIALAVWTSQYPFQQPWLTAKLCALVGYVGLGVVALKTGKTKTVRTAAFAGAALLFCYIVLVAVSKNVWPFAM